MNEGVLALLQRALTANSACFIYTELSGGAAASALEPKHIIFVRVKQMNETHESETACNGNQRAAFDARSFSALL